MELAIVIGVVLVGAGWLAGIASVIFRERWLEKHQPQVIIMKPSPEMQKFFADMSLWIRNPRVLTKEIPTRERVKVGRGIDALIPPNGGDDGQKSGVLYKHGENFRLDRPGFTVGHDD